jgi:polyisoprenoid-binding protein YceI
MIKSNSPLKSFFKFLMLCLFVLNARAESYVFEPANGKISFLAKGHPSSIKIKGEGRGPEGVLHESKGSLSGDLNFDLNSLDTGIELRDRHMKEKYLEVSKYPKAQLKIENLKAPPEKSLDIPFTGLLTLRGVEKAISGTYSVTKNGNDSKIEVSFPLKLTDFKIDIPSYMGITVAEEVTVEVASAVKRSAQP